MLISFEVSGFASIKDKICIDFSAGKNQRIKGTRYEDNYFEKQKLAKSVVLFGGNATGKTNILQALNNICTIIKSGFSPLNVNTGYLNNCSEKIAYKIKIAGNNSIYTYALEFNKDKILLESLKKDEDDIFIFENGKFKSSKFKEFEKFFSADSMTIILTRLDVADEIKDFRRLFAYIYIPNQNPPERTIIEGRITRMHHTMFDEKQKDFFENNKNEILNILSILDDSITGFKFDKDNISKQDNAFMLILKRNKHDFPFDCESSGIKKLLYCLSAFIIDEMNVLAIIDELDSSISTQALISLLNGFINSSSNQNKQFIFSSHNPLIFDTDMLCPRQIYIIDKKDCATTSIMLDEFELRNDKRKAYLNYLRGDYAE